MTKCKDCDLREENNLLMENLSIARGFEQMSGEKWTRLRADLRAWGKANLNQSELLDDSWIKQFWMILGDETIAEKYLRTWRENHPVEASP